MLNPDVPHLHTFFLFPFSIDQLAVMEEHPDIWRDSRPWFEKLDAWVTGHLVPEYSTAAEILGRWRRHPESGLDFHSQTYQEMMFFHPSIRRAFFDIGDADPDHEALVHRYVIPIPPGSRLIYSAEDQGGESAEIEVTDLGLLIFANGIGILTIGVEARNISYISALWINEMMRKVYPASGHQIETARIPNRMTLLLEKGAHRSVIAEERWESNRGVGYRPQLSNILLSLLHFSNYAREEFEVALDERMIVHSFISLDQAGIPSAFALSEEYEVAFSRLLYVDRRVPAIAIIRNLPGSR